MQADETSGDAQPKPEPIAAALARLAMTLTEWLEEGRQSFWIDAPPRVGDNHGDVGVAALGLWSLYVLSV